MRNKRVLAMLLAAAMAVSCIACGKQNNEAGAQNAVGSTAGNVAGSTSAAGTTEEGTDAAAGIDEEGFTHEIVLDSAGEINVFAFNEGQNYQKVIDKFEELTADTLKTSVNFQFASSIKEEAPLKLVAKEDVDLIFDASWVNMDKNIKDNMYADLTSYFNNDNYPGIKKAFPEGALDAMRAADGNIYGIPYYYSYNGLNCIFIRGDWREKYNLPEVTDKETLKQYLDTVQEHAEELGIASAMGLSERGYFYFCENAPTINKNGIFEITGTGARVTQNMFVLMNEDQTEVLDAGMVGDEAHDYAAWPNGKNPFNEIALELGNEWGKYTNEDAVTASSADVRDKFATGLYGATESGVEDYASLASKLAAYDPNAKLEFYVYDDGLRTKEGAYMNTTLSNNYMFVPYYCDDIDRVMSVVDWVFESQKNNDLWTLGIEGDDWKDAGEGKYELIENNDDPYRFPTYIWSDTPLYHRVNAELPDDVISYIDFSRDDKNFTPHPLAGFSFNNTAVTMEFTALNTLQEDYYRQFMIGSFKEDTQNKLTEFSKQAQGYQDKIREELLKQVKEFLQK